MGLGTCGSQPSLALIPAQLPSWFGTVQARHGFDRQAARAGRECWRFWPIEAALLWRGRRQRRRTVVDFSLA